MRPATWNNYKCKLKLYVLFCFKYDIALWYASKEDILAFTEFLQHDHKSADYIKGHLSALSSCFRWLEVNQALLDTFWWKSNLRAVTLSTPKMPIVKSSMLIEDLIKIL